ncbi:MAG: Ldh family oxidoreductase [Candidatus Diapherotrites archaeon]|nr:Ldh family oxidoreductase [Candidatus Diapherotrites archaeon]
MKVQIEEARELLEEKLTAKGLSAEDAGIVADEFMDGELRGRSDSCHGLIAFPIEIKGIAPKGAIEIEREGPAYALVNGNGNAGQLVGKFAMELAAKKAKESGVAMVGSYNHPPYLMPGYQARHAVKQGMIGIVTTVANAATAPFGGIDPVYGTNPIAIGIPSKQEPIIVDMATTVRAKGVTRYAKRYGEEIPEGCAIDKSGNPTRDPDEVHSMVAFGGYKGYGLGLAIEALVGPLVKAKVGTEKTGRGFLFQVIDPEAFAGRDEFEEKVSRLVEEVKASRKAEGVEEIFVPGEKSARKKRENLKNGFIEVDDALWEELSSL